MEPFGTPWEVLVSSTEHPDRASRRSAGEALAFRIGLQGSWDAPEMEASLQCYKKKWMDLAFNKPI